MDDTISQIGVGGIFVILVLRQLIDFLKSRKNESSEGFQYIQSKMQDLGTAASGISSEQLSSRIRDQATSNTLVNIANSLIQIQQTLEKHTLLLQSIKEGQITLCSSITTLLNRRTTIES